MKCTLCEKPAKRGSYCKSCHKSMHCVRCEARGRAIASLCLGCYRAWQALREETWERFLAEIEDPSNQCERADRGDQSTNIERAGQGDSSKT